jgi:hypothetical protein
VELRELDGTSQNNLLMGLLRHSSPTEVYASEYYKRDFSRYSERLGIDGIEFRRLFFLRADVVASSQDDAAGHQITFPLVTAGRVRAAVPRPLRDRD